MSGQHKQIRLQPRFRLMVGDEIALGRGKIALLQAIEQTGSLSQAAKQLGMSYRRAWELVQTMNQCFVEPVVITQTGGAQGGGMTLTAMGYQLIDLYQQLEQQALAATQDTQHALLQCLKNPAHQS